MIKLSGSGIISVLVFPLLTEDFSALIKFANAFMLLEQMRPELFCVTQIPLYPARTSRVVPLPVCDTL